MLQVRYRQGVLAGTVKIQVSWPLLLKISPYNIHFKFRQFSYQGFSVIETRCY